MKKLRKLAAVVLSCSMLLPMAVKAQDGEVIFDSPNWSECTKTLGEYGIFVGDENGDLNPYSNITKAEMSKALCVALGLEPIKSEEQIFADLDSSHWAYGYINALVANKVKAGADNYYIEPEHSVTYNEAVAMLIGALGYDKMLETYPEGYVGIAKKLGLTKNLENIGDEPCKRYEAFMLFNNALDVPFLILNGFNGGDAEFVVADGKDGNRYLTMRYQITGVMKEE